MLWLMQDEVLNLPIPVQRRLFYKNMSYQGMWVFPCGYKVSFQSAS